MRDHRPQLTMDVVVGKAGTQTPIFKDTLEHVVDERRLSGRAGASVGKRAAFPEGPPAGRAPPAPLPGVRQP